MHMNTNEETTPTHKYKRYDEASIHNKKSNPKQK
jgi:hypothetical protein